MKFDQLILRKIIEILAIRCQILTLKCTKNFKTVVAPWPGEKEKRDREERNEKRRRDQDPCKVL